MYNNLVVVELTNEEAVPYFNNEHEIEEYLKKMNINSPSIDDPDAFPTTYDAYKFRTLSFKLWAAILSGITGAVWWRVWINPENGYVIAYQDYEGKKFTDNFIRYVESVPSLDKLPIDRVVNKNSHLSIDTILEKIFTQGLESLTMEEVKFLDEKTKDL